MPLSDTPMPGLVHCALRGSHMCPASGLPVADGTGQRATIREIVGARANLREPFGQARFDMRIGSTGAPRRRQRQFARNTHRVFQCPLGIGVVTASRRIVDSKDVEGRLIHQDFDGLRNDAGDRAHRIAHRSVRRD